MQMRPQKKSTKLRSLIQLPKQKDIQINPEFNFGNRQTLQPQSVPRKNKQIPFHCRTQASSPIHAKVEPASTLPQLQLTKSSHHLPDTKSTKVAGSRTAHFLDSLIDILKQDKAVAMKVSTGKKVHTQNMSSEPEMKRSNPKKPKILRNQMTKMFFDQQIANRKIQSEDCYRKLKNRTEHLEQFTFYGQKKMRKQEEMPRLVNEFQEFVEKE